MAKVNRVVEILAEVQGSAAKGAGLADRLVRVGRDAMKDLVGLSCDRRWPSAVLAASDDSARAGSSISFL